MTDVDLEKLRKERKERKAKGIRPTDPIDPINQEKDLVISNPYIIDSIQEAWSDYLKYLEIENCKTLALVYFYRGEEVKVAGDIALRCFSEVLPEINVLINREEHQIGDMLLVAGPREDVIFFLNYDEKGDVDYDWKEGEARYYWGGGILFRDPETKGHIRQRIINEGGDPKPYGFES